MNQKISAEHLCRGAVVYVRQSTMSQVVEHTESQNRQYALAESARTMGFASVTTIDDDLGRSGSGSIDPDGHFKLPHLWSRKLLHPTAGQGCFLARFSFARKGFSSLLQAVTSAVEFKRVAMVHESVENGAAHGVITEVGTPVLDNAVGRDHGAAA